MLKINSLLIVLEGSQFSINIHAAKFSFDNFHMATFTLPVSSSDCGADNGIIMCESLVVRSEDLSLSSSCPPRAPMHRAVLVHVSHTVLSYYMHARVKMHMCKICTLSFTFLVI